MLSILLGKQCFWVEDKSRWAIWDYHNQDVFHLLGQKHLNKFTRYYPKWVRDTPYNLSETFLIP